MNDVLDLLQSRRTIRRYQKSAISQATLEKVLLAARSAQSWNNSQCWECIVVTDLELRKQLQNTVPSSNSAFRAVVGASALLCICAKSKTSGYFGEKPGSILGDWFMHDIGIMTQNICIQAHTLGLGTVVIGWFDHQAAKNLLALPQGYELISLIPIGYPDHQPPVTSRKNLDEFVHINRFGEKYQRNTLEGKCCGAATFRC
jgi:nitroreductase